MPQVNNSCVGSSEHVVPIRTSKEDEPRDQQGYQGPVHTTTASPLEIGHSIANVTASHTKDFATSLASLAIKTGTDTMLACFVKEEGSHDQSSILALSGLADGVNISRRRITQRNSVPYKGCLPNRQICGM